MNRKSLGLAILSSCVLAGRALAGLPAISGVGADSVAAGGVNYHVTKSTEIIVDGLPSTISDVKAGMIAMISQGLDRGTASSIVANTVPPVKKPKVAYDPKNKKRPRNITRSMGVGVTNNIVISVTDTRITYGVPGTPKAKAAFLLPATRVTIDGEKAAASELSVGMDVEVATVDGTHADMIRGTDANN